MTLLEIIKHEYKRTEFSSISESKFFKLLIQLAEEQDREIDSICDRLTELENSSILIHNERSE